MVEIGFMSVNARRFSLPVRVFSLIGAVLFAGWFPQSTWAQTPSTSACRIESKDCAGWRAAELSNPWVKVTSGPQLGGRVMQVALVGHAYLFVNPKYKGQYILPGGEAAMGRWINDGADQLWPMPEGTQGAERWPAPVSDALDDADYSFNVISRDCRCTVRLARPPDPKTGLRYQGLLGEARIYAADGSF